MKPKIANATKGFTVPTCPVCRRPCPANELAAFRRCEACFINGQLAISVISKRVRREPRALVRMDVVACDRMSAVGTGGIPPDVRA